MPGWKIIVTAIECEASRAERIARRLRHAWPSSQPVSIEAALMHELIANGTDDVHIVVIVGPGECHANTTLAYLTTLDEAGVPVVAVLDQMPAPGNIFEFVKALVLPSSTDDLGLASSLMGMLHREREIRSLRQELSISQRFHGGLEGQIAQIHEELQLASTVQREFLPREIPSLAGVTFGALWRPTNYVSGDIYDISRLDEDHIGMFLADAVGHGVPAALMTMVIVRSLVLKEVTDEGYRIVPPSEVLTRLNEALIRRQGGTTRFATAAYALINCRTREITFAGAGHPHPMVLHPDGTVGSLISDGGLLGVFENEEYKESKCTFDVGTKVVMYSDGFEQAFPDETARTLRERKRPNERYRTEFERLAEIDLPQDMIRTINEKLDDQNGSLHQLDDLTMLCMCINEESSQQSPQLVSQAA
ncbi:MAG: PP2C family protein-serine/threonine phosphatase [Planctomycetota bacterium]